MEENEKDKNLKNILDNIQSIDYSYAKFLGDSQTALELDIDSVILYVNKFRKVLGIKTVKRDDRDSGLLLIESELKKANHYLNSQEDTFI